MRPDAAAGERPLDPHALEQAADWLLRLSDRTVSDADRDACERWRRQDPEHARAWVRAERLLGLLATVPAAVARPVLDRPARLDRRAAVKHLGALALLAPSGWLAWRLWDQAAWDATLRTAVGERRHARLPDGSSIELDTGSVLDIAFGAQQRLLRVREGQALFTTAPDPQRPARPFRVATAHGRMQALGTRFSVRVEPTHTQLAVLEGAVQVEPDGQAGHARRIDTGQQVWFDRHGFGPVQDADARAIAWHRGMFAADALPLGQLLEELARYRRGVLRCDPAVASLPVSGAFPLDDTDRSLAMLAATYPITVERRAGGWWTTVVARRDP
ncbi:MAG: FecR domain-containing protein [Pseudomonas sp.]